VSSFRGGTDAIVQNHPGSIQSPRGILALTVSGL
jgi:hypothetical protein